jgi:type I restriction enzyme S subunit
MIQEKKISDFAEVITGGTPSTTKKEYWDGGNIPWLNSGELNKKYIYESRNFITELGLKNSSTRLMPPDTVLIALTGATCGLSALSKIEACANQSVTGILPSKSHIPEYLFHFLRTQRQRILDKAWGNAQPHISQAFVKDFKVPLPPLPDQLHIANLLSKAENLIAQRKESIHLLDEFLKSTFLEMFLTKDKRNNWNYKALKNTVEKHKHSIKAGPFGSSLKKEFYVPTGYKIYGQEQVIKDDLNYGDYYINEELYKKLESCKIKEDDVLISLVGTYGKLSIVPKKYEAGIINPRLMKISFDKEQINTIWFKHFFKSEFLHHQLKKYSHGNTMDIINVGIVKELIIPVPPIKLQTQFAHIVEKTEALKTQYQQSLQELENLYGSLSQKAFNGELAITQNHVHP